MEYNDLDISPLILYATELSKVVAYEGFCQIKLY